MIKQDHSATLWGQRCQTFMSMLNQGFVLAHERETIAAIRDESFGLEQCQLVPENVQDAGHVGRGIVQDKSGTVDESQDLATARLELEVITVEHPT